MEGMGEWWSRPVVKNYGNKQRIIEKRGASRKTEVKRTNAEKEIQVRQRVVKENAQRWQT